LTIDVVDFDQANLEALLLLFLAIYTLTLRAEAVFNPFPCREKKGNLYRSRVFLLPVMLLSYKILHNEIHTFRFYTGATGFYARVCIGDVFDDRN